ncbi:MAG: hypothetical protein PUB11_01875 [Oscillospiraceae bacterium]|nr:hypothetical protein [Oscillospiraceae bacterium]
MAIYFGSDKSGLKGVIAARTKDKIQRHIFTDRYALAVLCAGAPRRLLKYRIDGETLIFRELWCGMARDIFRGKKGYIYSCAAAPPGENLNGGYKSDRPRNIIGSAQIDIGDEIRRLEKSGRLVIERYAEMPRSIREESDRFLKKIIERYGLAHKTDGISKLYTLKGDCHD